MEDSYKDVLQGISSSCCHDMMECFGARERHYNAGDVICEYNQHSTLVGILKSGSADPYRRLRRAHYPGNHGKRRNVRRSLGLFRSERGQHHRGVQQSRFHFVL